MPGLRLFTSNRLERLAGQLARVITDPPARPFSEEVVVVQSRGMERWLSMQLAAQIGISANIRFPFPNLFLTEIARCWLPPLPDPSPFDPDILTFRIMQRLPKMLKRPAFRPLRGYLTGDSTKLKLYQLCQRIADTFDQYLVYRPDMIFRWEAGSGALPPEERWQAELWRSLVAGIDSPHRAALQRQLLQTIAAAPAPLAPLPERLTVFGISYLPSFHLEAFTALSGLVPVNLFLLNPCREYWADILSEGEIREAVHRYGRSREHAGDLHLEEGHPLLAALGRQGRDFIRRLVDRECEVVESFEPAPRSNLLTCLQSDILNLVNPSCRPPGDSGNDHRPPARATIDASIQIHSCHSPLREIEVLHDQLLALFDQLPRLRPRDVIVMAPDIESYAPFIRAVFDTPSEERLRIPYTIADQSARRKSRIVETFFSLLDLKDSRLGATQILALLDEVGVRQRFGLSETDVETLEHWVADLNVRWGADDGFLLRKGLPGFGDNTWQAGIDRLLLGLALPSTEPRLAFGVLPFDPVEGENTVIIGRLVEFADAVFRWSARLEQQRAPLQWQALLLAALERFFVVDESTEPDIQQIRLVLEHLGRVESAGGFGDLLSLEVVRSFCERALMRPHSGAGFIAGGVTFCAMLPMRSIPFEVVCLIGMNSDGFPRQQPSLGFDLMRARPRPGDRSRRDDDRYLFLEALISCRRAFYVSYVGQDIQDNTPMPPSVLVSELIDTICNGYGRSEADIVVAHPLQAFSPRYFDPTEPGLFSYSRDDFGAVRDGGSRPAPPDFFTEPLSEPDDRWRQVDLEDLRRFYSQPVRFFLQERLGLHLDQRETALADTEHFSLEALPAYRIGQNLLDARLAGKPAADFALQKAAGRLPHGNVGEVVYGRLEAAVDEMMAALAPITQGAPGVAREVSAAIGDFHLHGTLDGLYPGGRVQARFSSLRGKDLLSAWIGHLALCLLTPPEQRPVTVIVAKNAHRRLAAVAEPQKHFETLLEWYWRGLRMPLPLIPEAAYTFAEQLRTKRATAAAALAAARRKWLGSDFQRGEVEDPYFRLCFERVDPLGELFRRLAEDVVVPIIDHLDALDGG
jgi:exodeoxyribonuclease V gamma subunit